MSFATSLPSKSLLAGALFACLVSAGQATVVDWGPKGHMTDAYFIQNDGTLHFANGHRLSLNPVGTTKKHSDGTDMEFEDGFSPLWGGNSLMSFPFGQSGASTPSDENGGRLSLQNSEIGKACENFGYYDSAGNFGGSAGGLGGGSGGGSGGSAHSRGHARILSEEPIFDSGSQTGSGTSGDFSSTPTKLDIEVVPEASTALFGLALMGAVTMMRRRKAATVA